MSDNKANRFNFRAWHTKWRIWADSIQIIGVLFPEKDDAIDPDWVLMQSTGLLDRNQKEIFEGDICRFGPGIIPSTYEILWDKTRWLGKHGKELIDLLLLQKQSFDFASEYYCEVIGNCYENPELLK